MLFAAALVASVPCDGSPALACEVNTLAPANSSSVWALMGGHGIKLYQPVRDVLTVMPPPGVAPKALELVFVHGVYHGGFYWHGFQKELAVLGYTWRPRACGGSQRRGGRWRSGPACDWIRDANLESGKNLDRSAEKE